MLYFGLFYSTALILSGLSRDARLRYGTPAAVLLVAAFVGYTTVPFLLVALGYVALTAWMVEQAVPPGLRWLRYGGWFLFSAGLVVHAMPGYEGLILVEQATLKAGSVPTSLYFNHDKVLVAWSLLNALPLFRRSQPPQPPDKSWLMPLGLSAGALATLGLGVALGLIDWQPGISHWFWVFAAANLLNTCVAEELLFRGILQRQLARRINPLLALAGASVLFGLAHVAGGWVFVMVAIGAGVLYGLAYYWTGRLVWAVLVHWLFNIAHFALFTYPLSV